MSRVVSTDDDARRHDYVWFGTVDLPLPVGARLPAVAWMGVLTPVFVVAVWVLTPFVDLAPFPGPIVFLGHAALAMIVGAALAILVIRKVGKRVSKLTPLGHHVSNWRGELNTPRAVGPAAARTVSVPDLWAPGVEYTRRITTTIDFDSED